MNSEDPLREERKVAIARWADQYTERFDLTLTSAWPDLADRLGGVVSGLSWHALGFGPGADFRKQSIEPLVRDWMDRVVQPVVDEAIEGFRGLCPAGPTPIAGEAAPAGDAAGALHVQDALGALALPAGLLIGGGAVAAAIAEATVWLVFTTVVINWPLLVAGLLVGAALSFFGVYRLAQLRQALEGRFKKLVLPAVEDAIVGAGLEHDGKRIQSLKDQLIGQVRRAAEAARKALDAGG